jgi:hypothetical protein
MEIGATGQGVAGVWSRGNGLACSDQKKRRLPVRCVPRNRHQNRVITSWVQPGHRRDQSVAVHYAVIVPHPRVSFNGQLRQLPQHNQASACSPEGIRGPEIHLALHHIQLAAWQSDTTLVGRDVNKPTLFLRFQVTADLAGAYQHTAAAL